MGDAASSKTHRDRRRNDTGKEAKVNATDIAHQTPRDSKVPTSSLTGSNDGADSLTTEKSAGKSEKQRPKGLSVAKQPNFYTDRRITAAEFQRRHTWLQKTRISISQPKNRCRITSEISFPDNFNGLYSARFSPNGDLVAVSFGTGGIQVRSGETGELKATLRSSMEASFPVMCCRFNPSRSEIFYASSACGNIFACTTNTNEFTRFIVEPKNEINTIDVNITGEHIVSGGKDAAVRLYDAETGKMITVYTKNAADLMEDKVNKYHRMRVFATKFHHGQPQVFITGGWDDTVRVWDTRSNLGSVRLIKGPHICGDAIDAKDSKILTGSWVVSGSLQLWDMGSGKLVETINPQNRPTTLDGEFLYVVQFFDGDPYGDTVLCGGSGTSAVEIISLKDKKFYVRVCVRVVKFLFHHISRTRGRILINLGSINEAVFKDVLAVQSPPKVMGSFRVNKAIVTLDSNRTSIVFGGMEPFIRIADYS